MLSAEFGYSIPEIDEYMDIQRFEGCMRYRDFSPPIGALFKAFCGSLDGDGGKVKMSYGKTSSVGVERSKENDIGEFMSAFGGFGGTVTTK